MRILYYDWDEFNGEDCRDAMIRLGHQVDILKCGQKRYKASPDVENRFAQAVEDAKRAGKPYDLLFSFNNFPFLSDLCLEKDIPYVAWVFDSPHYPLYAININNPVNHVYVFDKKLQKELEESGARTIHYSPLAVNSDRLQALCKRLDDETDGRIIYEHDVSFVGSLYDNEFNFYDQIDTIPTELRGYFDELINMQVKSLGHDVFNDEWSRIKDKLDELLNYVTFENTGNFNLDYRKVMLDILRKKATVIQRRMILENVAKKFDTVIYTNPDAAPIEGVPNLGIASYMEKMPRVFHRSKINLNITMRSIQSGIPLRVLDVLAAGGFLITNYQPEIAEYFEDGKDLIMVKTPEEISPLIRRYLICEEDRKQIALNGQKKVFEKYAYTKLLPRILGLKEQMFV